MSDIDIVLVLVIGLYFPVLATVYALFVRRHKTAERVSPDMHTVMQKPAMGLPDGHRWNDPPIEIINTQGVFDRWICLDCGSHVDLRRGNTWPMD